MLQSSKVEKVIGLWQLESTQSSLTGIQYMMLSCQAKFLLIFFQCLPGRYWLWTPSPSLIKLLLQYGERGNFDPFDLVPDLPAQLA